MGVVERLHCFSESQSGHSLIMVMSQEQLPAWVGLHFLRRRRKVSESKRIPSVCKVVGMLLRLRKPGDPYRLQYHPNHLLGRQKKKESAGFAPYVQWFEAESVDLTVIAGEMPRPETIVDIADMRNNNGCVR